MTDQTMIDHPAELRAIRDKFKTGMFGQRDVWERQLEAAAAEIERLRADNRRWSKVADERSKENCALRQENEQLRAALTTIASFDDLHGTQKLAATGSYSGFDEPESTKFARKVLGDLEQTLREEG